jgi:hypothetical protein
MAQGRCVQLSEAQRSEVWRRWKAGESLHRIGRAFDRPHTSIHCLLAHHGGIVPATRRRSILSLTAVEREDISRGLASGSSIRDIARIRETGVGADVMEPIFATIVGGMNTLAMHVLILVPVFFALMKERATSQRRVARQDFPRRYRSRTNLMLLG